MKRFTNENIVNERLSVRKGFIWALTILIIAVAAFFLGTYLSEKDEKKAVDLEKVVLADEDNQLASVSVYPYVYKFAVYDGSAYSYYIIMNEQYMYVAYMKDSYADSIYDETSIEKIKLTGVTKKPGSDIKKLAIEVYNETYPEDTISTEDYDLAFGKYYLDTTIGSTKGSALFIIGFIGIAISIIIFVVSLVKKIRFSKSLKNISDDKIMELDSEMNDKDAFYYAEPKLYLTKHYIINFKGKFSINKYEDIVWLYPYEFRYNGVQTNKAIKFMAKDGKTYFVANVNAVSKKSTEVYNEIWDTIVSKNDKMMLGYTKENIQKAKEYKKQTK